MSETWDGPGDGWYPGDDDEDYTDIDSHVEESSWPGDIPNDDDDEEFELDQAEAAGIDRDAAREALHEYSPDFTRFWNPCRACGLPRNNPAHDEA